MLIIKNEDERLPIVFNALSDPNRCNIFRSFLKRDRLCVSDIAKTLGISMSLASQHLKVLEITKLLTREREGRTIYFRPNTSDELVRSIIKAVQ
jgi:DNA-binding transcriptional ArsR family regulator